MKISKTAAAVRAGLLATTAMLSLAGANAAFAQTCTPAAPAAGGTTTCTGAFTDSVNNHFTDAADITVIIDAAATVTTAAGVVGIDASWAGDLTLTSYGTFDATNADAIYVTGDLSATVGVYGDVYNTSLDSGDNALDVYVNFGPAYVTVGGNLETYGAAGDAYTVFVTSDTDAVEFTLQEGGSITAYSVTSDGQGVGVYAYGGDATVAIGGDVSATGGDDAFGVWVYGYDYATATNTANITATAGNYAVGLHVYAYNDDALADNAGGTITVTAAGAGYTYAYGMYAYSYNSYGAVVNSGDVVVTATADYTTFQYAYATGAYAYGYLGGSIDNSGDITVEAYGYYGLAIGAQAIAGANGDAYIYNSGSISASTSYYGYAYGAEAIGYNATITNGADGSIYAYSAYGRATGAISLGEYAYINNYGDIEAYAAYGIAIGAAASANTGAYVYNDGSIYAHTYVGTAAGVAAVGPTVEVFNTANGSIGAYSYYGAAIGVYTIADNATVMNYGDIEAFAYYGPQKYVDGYYAGFAIGVLLGGGTTNYLYNAGTITADSYYDGFAYAILSPGIASEDLVVNQGTINGSIYLGGGDDILYNGADGTINLDNYDVIDMGLGGLAGDTLDNYGTITFNGSAAIYNYSGNGLYNAGDLNSQDGAANDYLFIGADFSGDGNISLDVDGDVHPGHTNLADYVYIYGDVAADSTTAINVDLLSLPHDMSTVIDLVGVSGTSVAGNFVLGDVVYEDNNFLDLDFSIIADIDATNVTPDVFSLGIEVVGLSDPGTLALAVPGANISLINSEVGTFRQRMGVIDGYRKEGISLWARVFTDKGDFSPNHTNVGFGQGGNYDWHQRNSGFEAGVDFAVTEAFALGVLAGKSEADVDLNDAGIGQADIEADTFGVYANWIQNNWYLDASYRWTDFKNRLTSIGGAMRMDSDAQTFNIEAGYAWVTASGLKIEPQAQYTSTKFDNFDVLIGDISQFQVDDAKSSRGRVGVSLRKDFGDADSGWMWTPYGTLSAVREFDGTARYTINEHFYGESDVEGTSAMLELGFNARSGNLAFYGGLTWQDGGAMESFIGGHLGVRYTFGGVSAPAPVVVAPPPAKTCADLDDDGDGVNNCDDKCAGSMAGTAVGADGCPVPAPEPEPVMEPKPYRG